jgi:hypothetical protein
MRLLLPYWGPSQVIFSNNTFTATDVRIRVRGSDQATVFVNGQLGNTVNL